MAMTKEQMLQFAKEFGAFAAIYAPGTGTSLNMLILAATQLNDMVNAVKAEDPALWEKSVANFKRAHEAFDASQPR